MAKVVIPAFLKANVATLFVITELAILDEFNIAWDWIAAGDHIISASGDHGPAGGHHGAGGCDRGPHRALSFPWPPVMTRIVTSTYRYKRPPRKRKAVPLEGPAIVRKARRSQRRHPRQPTMTGSRRSSPRDARGRDHRSTCPI
jgi:hypothetical protein